MQQMHNSCKTKGTIAPHLEDERNLQLSNIPFVKIRSRIRFLLAALISLSREPDQL
jgi:hypothetical protein